MANPFEVELISGLQAQLTAMTAERDQAIAREAVLREALVDVSDRLRIARSYDGAPDCVGERIHQRESDKFLAMADRALADPSPAAERLLAAQLVADLLVSGFGTMWDESADIIAAVLDYREKCEALK